MVPLLLLATTGVAIATPGRGAGVELISASPTGNAGTTNAGKPDSTRAVGGSSVGLGGPAKPAIIAFESVAKDLLSGGNDVNGMADIYLFDTGAHDVTKLVSVATNGKAGCAGTPMCVDGGSHNPVAAEGSLGSMVLFESDAQNLTAGYLPAITNAQTQIFARSLGADTTTLVTKSAANPSTGASGRSSELATGGGLRFAFTFAGDIKQLQGLAGLVDGNSSGSDVVYWDLSTGVLKAASVRQSAPTQTGNGSSSRARMSADESCIVFESTSNDLDVAIAGSHTQIYVRDIAANKTTLVSKLGTQGGNLDSGSATPNADCSAIVFESHATNLLGPGFSDTNSAPDVFLWTRAPAPKLTLVSAAGSATGNGGSRKPRIATSRPLAQGIVVAFESDAGNLVAGDSPGTDVFVWRSPGAVPTIGTISSASARFAGQGSAGGHDPVLAKSGSALLFVSDSDQLAQGIDPDFQSIWLRALDLPGAPIALASASNDGTPANAPSDTPIFANGRVVFQTTASNLVASGVDANGAIDLYSAAPDDVTVSVVGEGVAEGASFDVTVARPTSDLSSIVTLTLSAKTPVAGPAATVGADLTLGTITLQAGEVTKTVGFPTLQDYIVEGDEGFQLHAEVSKGFAFVASGDVSIVIEDDDHDVDGDGVNDETDNCVTASNPDQLDSDADGEGNACDATEGACNNGVDDDADGFADCDDTECASDATCGSSAEEDAEGDGVPNINDNCVGIANADQLDTDADGIGNACDTTEGACGNFLDDDADGDADCDDADCDADIVCAAPASDDDGDGVPNGMDVCPLAPDPLQEDTDSDGFGDACDDDEGLCNDGVDNDADRKVDCADENCSKDAVCQKPDEDTDGDGFDNAIDDCPFVANADQSDGDGDGAGDVCDAKEDACANMLDDDDDANVDCADENCANTPVCADPMGDVDADGAVNDADNCPNVSNPDQADADADGVGDACDKNPNGPPAPSGEGGAGGATPQPQPQPEPADPGCSCSVPSDGSSESAWIAAFAGVALLASRRRRR